MEDIRRPVVAGSFYPANPKILKKDIENYLEKAQIDESYSNILGIISPHAGYVYSGECAAYGFKALSQRKFKRAVVVAPSHQASGFFFSVGDYKYYETPLGKIKVDQELTRKLLSDSSFTFYPYAHMREHSLEVQLPFLQVINHSFELIPIIIGHQYHESSIYLAKFLAKLLKDDWNETVVIASSDLSHYHNSKTAKDMDSLVEECVSKLDSDTLGKNIHDHKSEACGIGGIMMMMNLAKLTGYTKIKNLKYMHSGEVSGDTNQVVGYLSSIFYK